MAEPESPTIPAKRPIPNSNTHTPQTQEKLFSNFIYKAVFLAILVVVLPFFPSQPPEFVTQSILTRSWELFHLLLVGIAISYGLFSRRNADPDADKDIPPSKSETPTSYVSSILQVFGDDEDIDNASSGFPDETKIQTWSSQYNRGEPVALFLPVRSLKSCDGVDGDSVPDNGSCSISKSMEEMVPDSPDSEMDDVKESVVLPSPIPWRSRSGRMEVKEESPTADLGFLKSQSFRFSIPRPASSSPSPSVSPEMTAKTSEDSGRKKSSYKSSPPLPPPPPPLPVGHGSLHISDRKDTRSFKDELKDLSRRGREESLRSRGLGFDSLDTKPRTQTEGSLLGRSVRTVRWKEAHGSNDPDGSLENLDSATHQHPPSPLKSEKDELMEKVIVKSDDSSCDSDTESSDGEIAASLAAEAKPDENEVDKKADEFIAKFREQIRLQRIESIKRTSGQRSVRSPK